jgi:hypothetical protein
MRRKPIFHTVVFGMLVLAWMLVPVWAAPPDIQLSLSFIDRSESIPTYLVGEPVGVLMVVSYGEENPPLLVSRGFQDAERRYYLEMRVRDPIGRVLVSRSEVEHIESPDAPPLPWAFEGGRSFQVTGCEVLCPGFSRESATSNLGQYYDISLPGYYSVQAQLSVTVFRGIPPGTSPCEYEELSCEDGDYDFNGVVKSATRYFYVQGSSAGVQVIPNQWSTKWVASEQEVKQVQIHLKPDAGETTADYLWETVRLNGVKPYRVEGLKPMIKAYFNATELIKTLGPVQVGQWYTVYISGQRKVGASYQYFGKTQTVRIVN